jgi:hypothetical protein
MSSELGQPHRVRDISLSARDVLDLPGIDEQHLERAVFQQVVERFPVVAGGLHHHERDLLLDQVLTQRQDLPGHRRPGRDRFGRASRAWAGQSHTHLHIPFRHVQPRAARVHQVHR